MTSGLGEHQGICIGPGVLRADCKKEAGRLVELLGELGLGRYVDLRIDGEAVRARMAVDQAALWAPGLDTTGLAGVLANETHGSDRDLERETLVSLLLSPIPLDFPSFDEFDSARRIRSETAEAAAGTALTFDVEQSRPEAFWRRTEDGSFALRPGCSLVEGLSAATQPRADEGPYGFGCYRASEYVMLLAIAREASRTHPALKARLRERSARRPIESREFHEALLRELGTFDDPLPARWFVPGDRIWFRNPDAHSADAEGYEGSWVVYLGGGLFSNFWKRNQPFTLERKCVEIYHWRDSTCRDDQGRLTVDEAEVARRVAETEADLGARAQVLEKMNRWRDPRGVYADGGCLDRTRECARWVRPENCDMLFAAA